MLASADQQPDVNNYGIPGLEVVLPPGLTDFFHEAGYTSTTAREYRGSARLRIRRVADISFIQTPAALLAGRNNRARSDGKTLVKDLSRSGIGIVYHEQVFPEELFQVRFQGRTVRALAVRCRRLCPKCFEIGARIISLETFPELEATC